MSKFSKIFMALALFAAVAAPAMAEVELNGYYRLQGYAYDHSGEENTSSFIDQRMRLKVTNTLNDYIQVVYFGEVDAPFGEPSKGGIGGGGQIRADGVNIETKNMYVDFKIPETTWAVRTGLQGFGTGNEYEDLIISDDMAAISAAGKVGPADIQLIYSKWNEGDRDAADPDDRTALDRAQWDDSDFYAAKVGFKANEQLGLGVLGIWRDENAADADFYYGGANADFRFADFGVKAFALYGNADSDALDGSTWMADIAGFAVVPNGNLKLHAAYFPDDEEAAIFATQGEFEYHNDNLMLFLTDVYYNNAPHTSIATREAAFEGFGLWFVTVSGDQKLPMDAYFKYGAGYFAAVEDEGREGDMLGAEVAATVGKKFAEYYDLSLRGAYGFLGDFFDGTAADGGDPDDLWQVVAMLNVAF